MRKIALLLCILVFSISASGESFDTILAKYMDTAVKNNPGLKAQNQIVASAEMEVIQARANMLPSLEAVSRYTRAGGGRKFKVDLTPWAPIVFEENFMREREHETKLSLQQPIFTGGQIYHNYRANKLLYQSAKFDCQAYERGLKREVAEAYISCLCAVEQVKTVEKSVELGREILRTSRVLALSSGGIAADTLRARAQLANAKANLTAAKNGVKIATLELKRLTGIKTADVKFPSLPPTPERIEMTDEALLAAEKTALTNRMEFKSIEMGLAATQEAVKAARGRFLPSLSLAADYGWQGKKYRFNREEDLWMVSGVLQWNIFNGFGDRANYDISRIKTREMRFKSKELEEAVKLQVRSAAAVMNSAYARWEAARENIQAAEENYRIRKVMFQSGRGTMVEMLDAAELLVESISGEIIGGYRVLMARINLRWAKGESLLCQ